MLPVDLAERPTVGLAACIWHTDTRVNSTGRRNTSMRRCVDGTAKRVGGSGNGKACDAVAGRAPTVV
jgi:hypothetical protein